MFDAKAEIEIAMHLQSGGKSVVVRWPSDEEWAARASKRKILFRRLGRGMSETVTPEPGEADVALYEKIALNGTPTLTKGEAYQVAEALAVASATGVTVEGDRATVTLTVLTGQVSHNLGIPNADQVITFRRGAFRMFDLPFNTQELRLKADAGAKLWDACGGKSDDYAGGTIPAIHKDAAARAVVEYLDRNLGPQQDDSNF
jgi:hypothetical protein